MKAVIAFPLTTTTTVGCFCVTCLCYEYRSNVAAATTSVQAGFEVLTKSTPYQMSRRTANTFTNQAKKV